MKGEDETRVVIVGSGNVAESLACAIRRRDGMRVVQVFARNPERGPRVARMAGAEWCGNPQELAAADVYLISVSDRAVAGVASSLPFAADAIVAHTAGCVPLDAIPSKYRRRAVIYPFQTFSAGRHVNLRRVPLFLETSDAAAMADVEAFAHRLSDRVGHADSALRQKIHLAGVFVSNFVNNMYASAAEIIGRAGLPFDVLAPLIEETARKAVRSGDPASVQTGPAARGDMPTLERHLKQLGNDPLLEKVYKDISENIWQISKRR